MIADAQTFLTDFTKDIIKHPMERQELIAGYAKVMQSRDTEIIRSYARRTKQLASFALSSVVRKLTGEN